MSKSLKGRLIRKLKARYKEDLAEATAYLCDRIDKDDKAILALSSKNSALTISEARLKDSLMAMTLRLAVAHGFAAAITATSRGEDACIAAPMIAIEDVIPGQPWWH